ncbi:MAG: hypothetical protein ACQEXQ_23970 [Bacillota bacterium]
MIKTLIYTLLTFLVVTLTACGGGGFDHGHIKQVLEGEGLEVNYTDNMAEDFFEYEINGKAHLKVSVLKSTSEVKENRKSLEQNAHEKQYEVQIFEVEHLLLAYYPPEDKDKELEKRIRNAITKLKK